MRTELSLLGNVMSVVPGTGCPGTTEMVEHSVSVSRDGLIASTTTSPSSGAFRLRFFREVLPSIAAIMDVDVDMASALEVGGGATTQTLRLLPAVVAVKGASAVVLKAIVIDRFRFRCRFRLTSLRLAPINSMETFSLVALLWSLLL